MCLSYAVSWTACSENYVFVEFFHDTHMLKTKCEIMRNKPNPNEIYTNYESLVELVMELF